MCDSGSQNLLYRSGLLGLEQSSRNKTVKESMFELTFRIFYDKTPQLEAIAKARKHWSIIEVLSTVFSQQYFAFLLIFLLLDVNAIYSQSIWFTLAFIQGLIRLITVFTLAGITSQFVAASCGLIVTLVLSSVTLIHIWKKNECGLNLRKM